ncbi:hypothetical protein [Ruegeria atlantica]|uniref:hypothetical protein n=1 Tax=Ruegeria atlantica TaxID=81569 RepID=UPI00147B444D|nr:hypothetical protein [Ruegeria atlantica]
MKKEELYKQKPFVVGGLLSVLIIGVFAYFLSVGEVCDWANVCETKWQYLQSASPNEIGDTLAGFAGTLAFIWIVVTVWLQAEELQEQRKEFVKMADAQSNQFKLISSQQEDVNQEAVLLGVKRRLEELDRASVGFFVSGLQPPHNYSQLSLVPRKKNLEVEKYYLALNDHLSTAAQLLAEGRVNLEMSNDNGFCGQKAQIIEALSYLKGLLLRKSNLSLAGKMYQSDLKIGNTVILLDKVLALHSESDGRSL